MRNYAATIDALWNAGYIKEGDYVIICQDEPPASAGFFGLISAAVAMASCKHYVLAANNYGLNFFDIDKRTGDYLNTGWAVKREEIIKLSIRGFGRTVVIKRAGGTERYSTANRFYGYRQKEAVTAAKNFLKTNYVK
ncbi:MAG: hypothetical protein LBS99_07505 [Clostridiales bacterium]|jgi:hypothetical protein|nr:hypothetical protein [Clostridiales bacterium]